MIKMMKGNPNKGLTTEYGLKHSSFGSSPGSWLLWGHELHHWLFLNSHLEQFQHESPLDQ